MEGAVVIHVTRAAHRSGLKCAIALRYKSQVVANRWIDALFLLYQACDFLERLLQLSAQVF